MNDVCNWVLSVQRSLCEFVSFKLSCFRDKLKRLNDWMLNLRYFDNKLNCMLVWVLSIRYYVCNRLRNWKIWRLWN